MGPVSHFFLQEDNFNLNLKSEKIFTNDRRFWLPLYLINIIETLTWIWALILMSDQVEIDMQLFKMKPETFCEYFKFTMMTGLFCGLNAIGGHELIHKKEWYNKAAGTWSYTKFFYSHFLDEHIKGHHKNIATDDDPATARKGEVVYSFVVRSAIGSHFSVARMENQKVLREHGEDAPLLKRVLHNKMTHYLCLHLTILALIYALLGW